MFSIQRLPLFTSVTNITTGEGRQSCATSTFGGLAKHTYMRIIFLYKFISLCTTVYLKCYTTTRWSFKLHRPLKAMFCRDGLFSFCSKEIHQRAKALGLLLLIMPILQVCALLLCSFTCKMGFQTNPALIIVMIHVGRFKCPWTDSGD